MALPRRLMRLARHVWAVLLPGPEPASPSRSARGEGAGGWRNVGGLAGAAYCIRIGSDHVRPAYYNHPSHRPHCLTDGAATQARNDGGSPHRDAALPRGGRRHARGCHGVYCQSPSLRRDAATDSEEQSAVVPKAGKLSRRTDPCRPPGGQGAPRDCTACPRTSRAGGGARGAPRTHGPPVFWRGPPPYARRPLGPSGRGMATPGGAPWTAQPPTRRCRWGAPGPQPIAWSAALWPGIAGNGHPTTNGVSRPDANGPVGIASLSSRCSREKPNALTLDLLRS